MQARMLPLSTLYRTVLGAVALVALAAVGVKATSWLKTAGDSSDADSSSPEQALAGPLAILYIERDDGFLQKVGMATAFDHTGLSYRFVTTEQCLAGYDSEDDNHLAVRWRPMYLHLDDWGKHGLNWILLPANTFITASVIAVIPASVIAVGDGIAVLEARLEAPIFTVESIH